MPFACCTASETTWNGTAWSPLTTSSPSAVPPLFQLVPDEADHSVVAYSSEATWTWSGQAWSQHHPSRTPGIVSGATMVYDGSAGRVLLFGGMTASSVLPMVGSPAGAPMPPMPAMPAYTNALWSWDGTTWSQVSGTALPPAPLPAPASPPVTVVPPIVPASPPVPEPCVPAPAPAPGAAVACPGKPPVPLPTATPL
jgi:hypothetical protein